ncbi:hypothetical protein MYCOZU1_02859 [Mycobacterium intracellulare subsp. chimaera]|nr:hypothetical protein MYCODSM44623_02746 [Mycobacterium intracellulare subsp. chimaera]ASL21276.1 hypothetical protein MYCOZU1_02859 [Mycobacterium intracellulare subsp. chimaera]
MPVSMHSARGAAIGAVGAGVIAGAALFGALPSAQAAPASLPAVADVADATFDVSPATSAYLPNRAGPLNVIAAGRHHWWHWHHHWWHWH